MDRKLLLVGDIHVVPEELEDCAALMNYVEEIALREGAKVCLLGDQYNNHQVIRAEVLWFWQDVFVRLMKADIPTMAIVGNHDFAGEGALVHSHVAHREVVRVVDEPLFDGGILVLPYMASKDEFLKTCCEKYPQAKTIICHQTFDGSKYENGFFAKDGIDAEQLPQKNIISGHIHTPQSFGKVTYVGSPRWRTLSDANVPRALWLYTFDETGNVTDKKSFDTGKTCRQIRYVVDTPDHPVTGPLDSETDWRVDIRGPSDWIERRKAELAGPGVRLRTFKTDKSTPAVKESDGIGKAFGAYLGRYTAKHGTPREQLSKMAQERLGVL